MQPAQSPRHGDLPRQKHGDVESLNQARVLIANPRRLAGWTHDCETADEQSRSDDSGQPDP
jgi:hypothetical protein